MKANYLKDRLNQIEDKVTRLHDKKRQPSTISNFLVNAKVFIEETWLNVANRRSKNLHSNFESKKVPSGPRINFDKCLVLSLERRKDRQRFMHDQFKREEIDYEIFKAIDGQELDVSNIPVSLISQKTKKYLSNSQMACALSHYNIWLTMIENDWQNLLVFEDDSVIKEGLADNLQIVMSEVPHDYDYLIIGSCFDIYIRKKVSEHLFIPFNTCCTHGYILSRRGAEKLLRLATPFDSKSGGIDIGISDLIMRNLLNAYHAAPLLCGQQNLFDSNIEKGKA